MARRGKGFTLVEMLVVIAIIGILAGLLTPAVQTARKNAIRRQCYSLINNLAMACEQFKADLGFYPDAAGFEQFEGLDTQASEVIGTDDLYHSDVLYMWLCNQFAYRGKAYGPYYSPKGKEVLPRPDGATYKRADGNEVPIMYFVDPWGQPLVYIDFTNYGNDATNPKTFDGPLGELTAATQPQRDAQGRPTALGTTFYNPQSFQIYSVGANGISGHDPQGNPNTPGWFGTDTPESGKYWNGMDPKILDDVNNWD